MITKKNPDFSSIGLVQGDTILLNKPYRWSSFKVIHELRKRLGVRKAGHAGTLDPLATGLLIVCTGKNTKKIEHFQSLPKTYSGSIFLGCTTRTMDAEAEPEISGNIEGLTENEIRLVVKEFIGEIQQIPPMYSAINFNGKKLYQYARKGKVVEREARTVSIYEFNITSVELPLVNFSITCSKGTYIRVLAHDFGAKLGCGGYLYSLKRDSIGEYSVLDSFEVDELYNYREIVQNSIRREISEKPN